MYHIAGSERISRYEFAMETAEVFGLDRSLVTPVRMEDLKFLVARRPRDSFLSVDKAKHELKVSLLNIREGLQEMRRTRS